MSTSTVVLRVPATTSFVRLARTTVTSLLARMDFTLDDIADAKLALDEAAALLLVDAAPESVLEYRFTADGDALRTEVIATTRADSVPGPGSFQWMVLTTLAEDVEAHRLEDGRACLSLVSRRVDA